MVPTPPPPAPPPPPQPPGLFPGLLSRNVYDPAALSSTLYSLTSRVDDHSAMLACDDPGRRMAESEADDDSEPSQVEELRAMVEALTAQMAAQSAQIAAQSAQIAAQSTQAAAQSAELASLKAGLQKKVAQDPELKEQLFGQPTLSPVE